MSMVPVRRSFHGGYAGERAELPTSDAVTDLILSVESRKPVNGLTHTFYRYPARFSPEFARSAIRAFSCPGDIILDPFMGGGTTLVEAMACGRNSIGCDLNSLAVFVARAKTTLLSHSDMKAIDTWGTELSRRISLRKPVVRNWAWVREGYQRNITDQHTWRIRKTIELLLCELNTLESERQRRIVRCAILRAGQWALDNRKTIPATPHFREKFSHFLSKMLDGAIEFASCVRGCSPSQPWSLPLMRSAQGIEAEPSVLRHPAPKLILTSPPYPGLHILYHRWQVQGRRETAAPFWVADCLDGMPSAYYTFGDRKQKELETYYNNLLATFSSIARVANEHTILVQMVAFSDPSWQLPRYLDVMKLAGFEERALPTQGNSRDGRLWRVVPNRKWYAAQKVGASSCQEVVLVHRLA